MSYEVFFLHWKSIYHLKRRRETILLSMIPFGSPAASYTIIADALLHRLLSKHLSDFCI